MSAGLRVPLALDAPTAAAPPAPPVPAGPPPGTGAVRSARRTWAGLWVLSLALGMIVLDGTIVAVALPAIIADLHLELAQAQWVTSLYSVVFAALLLTSGRLGDRWGRRRVLLVGLLGFVLGSALAAMSGGAGTLLLARALQGVGGAMVLPATLSTVNATFRGPDRAAAFGIWGAVMSGAAAIGPLLGGVLTEVAGWQSVFWVNVPLGVGVLVAALRLVDETRSEGDERGMDVVGPLLSALAFGLIVFGLIEAGSLGWWRPTGTLTLAGWTWPATAALSPVPVALAVGAAALTGLVLRESRRERLGLPTVVDLRLFALPTFALGNLTATLVAVGEFALLFVLPLFLVSSLGLGTLAAGLVLAAMAGGAFLAGAAARHLAATLGATRVVLVGLVLEAAGAAATAVLVAGSGSPWGIALALLPYGLGLGLASAQLTSTVLHDVPAPQSGAGSAIQSTVRQLGAALGGALGGAVLAGRLGASAAAGSPGPVAQSSATSTAIWAAVTVLVIALLAAWRLDGTVRGAGPGR